MRFEFVTYRWGKDLIGGAELHHRRLALELVELGHKVSVQTTTGHGFRPFCHWGVIWDQFNTTEGDDEGITVHRHPIRLPYKWELAIAAKSLQQEVERLDQASDAEFLAWLSRLATPTELLVPLTGFHYPEVHGDKVTRWTMPRATVYVQTPAGADAQLVFRGNSPKPATLTLWAGEYLVTTKKIEPGWFELRGSLPPGYAGVVDLRASAGWKPLADFRTLAVSVDDISIEQGDLVLAHADLWQDHRSLARRDPEKWQAALLDRAKKLAGQCRKIDRLRGPRSYRLRLAVEESKADHVIHCNMPWATTSLVRQGDLAMALWHVEDEFYYWQHWIDALKRSRFVLANTPYTAGKFFPGLGIKAHFVGPPIWPVESAPTSDEVAAFKRQHKLHDDKQVVLTVCRKSGEKGYRAVAEATEAAAKSGAPVTFLGVGPDQDRRPLDSAHGQWIGPLTDRDLQIAYAACDVFVLMSESESFGMVIPEAWHHGKPVVVNRECGPAASLVGDGETGLLARRGDELVAALVRLAGDGELRRRLGEAGRVEARAKYVRGSAAGRLLDAIESTRDR